MMRITASKRRHVCLSCSASFSRREHLQRHQLQHTSMTPFGCTFCTRHFGRRDILVRHLRSCKERLESGQDVPKLYQQRRGAKKRACDTCTRLKRACSGRFPCSVCTTRNRQCSLGVDYPIEDALDSSEGSSQSIGPLIEDTTADTQYSVAQKDLQVVLSQLPTRLFPIHCFPACPSSALWPQKLKFFERFFHGAGLVTCFDCSDSQRHLLSEWSNALDLSSNLRLPPQVDEFSLPMGSLFDETLNFDFSFPTTYTPTDPLTSFNDHLGLKSREIVLSIKDVANRATSAISGISWTPLLEDACYGFFSTYNLHKYLTAFRIIWQPNWPVFHRATFNAAATSAPLVAGMAIIGACCAPEDGQREAAAQWFDIVEEWIFNHEDLRNKTSEQGEYHVLLQTRLDALRAAYCVVLYQSWEGHHDSKLRARQVLHPELVTVCRDLKASRASHGDLNDYIGAGATWANWKQFILKEELIRTITYVFLLDSAYATFFNMPPRLTLHELQMDFTCPGAVFEGNDPETWFTALQTWASATVGEKRPLINEATIMLCQGTLPLESQQLFMRMSTLNYFTIMHAFQYLIFNLQYGISTQVQSSQLQQALLSFRHLWFARLSAPAHSSQSISDMARDSGFFRHIYEYWILACIVLRSGKIRRTCRVNESIEKLLNECDPSDMARIFEIS
ncbi:hypothetical protein BDV96DRAFT_179870 [Lophiotrema nucula]|uniref:C2H2-type domain-containing protein n=1 Tax=Lophiotrema nucula TaxID=690887 RepID=A0A6A5YXI3_9PLEO|nr:hypothetical protein BDV96DRAFT_179870 [Lophiotrema nucula]